MVWLQRWLTVALVHLCLSASVFAQPAATLDFDTYRSRVEPMFLVKRPGHVRCVSCHAPAAGNLRLQPLAAGAFSWTEAQSRQNFDSVRKLVVAGSPEKSRLLRHPLAREAGGDAFHGGGKHWRSTADPEWQILSAWVRGEPLASESRRTVVRIVQTNAAGDGAHLIDPASNTVVGVVDDIEIPHGVTAAPDGSRLYFTNESLHTVDAVDALTLKVQARIPLSGRPNNIAITPDGRKVYAGIAVAPGAVDVIDTASLTNVKRVPVTGAIHNVYVTPDGRFAVAGSIPEKTISVVDTKTDEVAWTIPLAAGIRPMAFETGAGGSVTRVFVQLSDFHGFAAVDWATRREVARVEHPAIPGVEAHTDGLQGAPAHGLGVSPRRTGRRCGRRARSTGMRTCTRFPICGRSGACPSASTRSG